MLRSLWSGGPFCDEPAGLEHPAADRHWLGVPVGALEFSLVLNHFGVSILQLAGLEDNILDQRAEGELLWCLPGLVGPGAAVQLAGLEKPAAGGWPWCSGRLVCMSGLECPWLLQDAAFMRGCRNPFGGGVSPKPDGFAQVLSHIVSGPRSAAEEHEAIREHKVQHRRLQPAFGPEGHWTL